VQVFPRGTILNLGAMSVLGVSGHGLDPGKDVRDPNRSFAAKFRRGAAVAGVLQGTVAWTLEILVAVNVVGGVALIAIGIHARRNGLARKQCQSGALDRLS
jgi:hypothetical protein